MKTEKSLRPSAPRQSVNVVRLLAFGLAAVFIFAVGLNVGNGRIAIGPNAAYRRSVQKHGVNDLNYTSVEAVYDQLRVQFDGQLDEQKLMDGLKQGLAQATGDPYTEYFNAKSAKEFNDELSGTFSGIGAELGKDANGNVIIISPIAEFPAAKAGLLPKDIIVEVDGKSTAGQAIGEVVNHIRGQEGTKVKLKVIRGGQELNFEITRAQIKVPSVKHEILEGNIGYLYITRFGDDTATLAKQAADEFKQKNVKAVILDLRQDPGGLLDAAVDVSSLWLPSGKTVLSEKRDGVEVKTYNSHNANPPLQGIKTVVLIDEGSASASEITAGALKDNGAVTLVGTKSFGKGSVQQLAELGDGSLLKVTIAHWFTPSGKGIDKIGIEPDQKVERSVDDIKAGKDPQKDAAIQFLNK